MHPVGGGCDAGSRAKDATEPVRVGVAGVVGDLFDLPIGRGEKVLGQLDASVSDEAVDRLADLVNEKPAEVTPMETHFVGNAADTKLGIAKVIFDELKRFDDCRVAGGRSRWSVSLIRRSAREFPNHSIRGEEAAQEASLSGHEVLNEDVEDFHVVEKGILCHGAGAGQFAGGQAPTLADNRDDGTQPTTIAFVPMGLGALPQLSQM